MSTLLFIGRIFYGGIFIWLAVNNFARLEEKTDMARLKRVPLPRQSVLVASGLALLGGLSIVFGYRIEIGVALLAVFLVPASLMMHRFWAEQEPRARQAEMVHFCKNVALLGAALMLLGLAQPWPFSLEG